MYSGCADQHYGHTTYSQHGEDLVIVNMFKLWGLDLNQIKYLDIGCHHPLHISNTALLHERGARGLCVDANPNMKRYFEEFPRPDGRWLIMGIGPEEGEMPFYMYDPTTGRNTFSEKETKDYGCVVTETKMLKVITIDQLVVNYFDPEEAMWPDFLSIDIEGLDLAVLKTATWSPDNRPKLICAEVRRNETGEFVEHLMKRGYAPIIRMGENILFADINMRAGGAA